MELGDKNSQKDLTAGSTGQNHSTQQITGTFQPKYIWKHTKLDGTLPIANFTSEVRIAEERTSVNLAVTKQKSSAINISDLCKISHFDQLSSDEEDDDDDNGNDNNSRA